jgi:dUTP pyrophosphatase
MPMHVFEFEGNDPVTLTIPVMQLPHGAHFDLPAHATVGAAGMDLRAAIDAPLILAAGKWSMVPTGIMIALPQGYEGQVRPRSGLAAKHGVTVLNSPGTVDSDYRGEIKVILINHSDEAFEIEPGMRIAQLVVAPHATVELEVFENLTETQRGHGGFGSTGTNR